jgi:methyltransferase (TIGR00027 family)
MRDAPAMTAKLAAAGRAIESRRPDHLFDDPLAAALAGDEGFRWMEEWRLPGVPEENPTIGPRTRFFDDLVMAAIGDGVRQVVLAAAGMDTRAFRLALPADTVTFEVDQPVVLGEKQKVLDREQAAPTCRRVTVPADLRTDSWAGALPAAGFDRSAPTVCIAEGLSCYLTENDNARLLDHLAALSPFGSRLGIDMLSRDYLDNPAVEPFSERLRSQGIPWQFGTNDPASFLATHGWHAEVYDFDVVGRRFARWPPCGVTEEVAAHAAKASRSFFIDARRALTTGESCS